MAKDSSPVFSRRLLLTSAGAGGAGLAVGALAQAAFGGQQQAAPQASDVVEFYGEHQAGITTAAQDRMHTVGFDVVSEDRDKLIALLKEWTSAIEAMTQGKEVGEGGATSGSYDAPPSDTGEAVGLSAANLSVTVGFGRSLFTDGERPRFGLEGKLPEALIELPHFSGDMVEDQRSHGDIVVQACANDPQVAVHAIRNLSRLGFGTVRVRWSQIGFGRTSKTTSDQQTPRNLFGFKDGTANILADDADALNQHVWVGKGATDQPWMVGGTYMVARRIRMQIEVWDRSALREQENSVGRIKSSGAPLSGGDEFTAPDLAMAGSNGPIIPVDSHVAVLHPSRHNGVQMLRRGFNYTDGSDGLGRLDAGLFFIAFVVDARTHFVPLQKAMSSNDAMNEYLRHTSSGLYAVPPGIAKGQYLGQQLFES
ncbi:iron uptake transporter deferrochelatase/peroxidase subunit [Glutamicibacter sp.]|uniref:iron uptake transporter deferrochelatase/peroxidase subunit n=1 Tax=Glutamicibacter sp. TaxID=1931995 RepID=UPI0028BDDA2A|nr:iron uptake transporter deferrochelatase/peroxidase subunit [Glutamicibacter sp.]